MENTPRNTGSLVGGALLILFGGLALLAQLFRGFDFWDAFWPFIVIGVGLMFFVGMVAGGKSTGGLAVPGSIITVIGLMLFVQNLTDHWESWAYGWAVIVMAVGLGIFIMGLWTGEPESKRSGLRVLRTGTILFIIFGAFFEMIFSSSNFAQLFFPIALILFGGYLVFARSGWLARRQPPQDTSGDSAPQ